MAAVAMDLSTFQRKEVICENGVIRFKAKNDTLLMAFVCRREPEVTGFANQTTCFVNYLEPDSVDKLIACTYQRFYDRFRDYFGTTIRYAFYDEPSMYKITGARIWTTRYNQWCVSHGLVLTGHTDQEEIPNHTLLSGDLMYTLAQQGIPGVDL